MEQAIFRALGDATRRHIFEKLASGPQSATALRDGMAISQPAMSQHLAVLRDAGLVQEKRVGRFTEYAVEPQGLAVLGGWLAKYRAYWPERLAGLEALTVEMERGEKAG